MKPFVLFSSWQELPFWRFYKFYLIVFLLPVILQGQITFDPGDLDMIAKSDQKRRLSDHLQDGAPPATNYDVKWYGCRWIIDPAVRAISGSVTILFQPTGKTPDSLTLDLNSALTVDSVLFRGSQVSWNHFSDRIVVSFPAPQTSLDSVTVYYHGVPPLNGSGSFVQGFHNDIPIIWTLSEPYGARDWWPCKQGLTDKADSVDLFISVPAGFTAVANGVLVAETRGPDQWQFHWRHRYPVATYLLGICVTRFSRYDHTVPFGGDTLNVPNFVYPEDSAMVSTQTAQVVPMIQLFDTLFGIYPFQNEHYGHTQFGWGGGMEHQTMSFMGSFGFELLAHELAHSWFGNKITCGSWSDIWLNEGFATYLSGLCYEHLAPSWWYRFREVRIQNIVSQPGGSVFCSDTTDESRIFDSRLSYAKGAMILHQLRWIMGDSAFYTALNHYLADALLSYGFARTSDLKKHLEQAYGADLTWYFDAWFTGEGYPSYRINWFQSGDQLSFTIHQTCSHPSVDFFRMLLPLRLKNSSTDTTLTVWNSIPDEIFTITLPFTADSLLFDPDRNLITGANTVNAVADPILPVPVLIYPNPAKGWIIVVRNTTLTNQSYEIFGNDGRKLLSGTLSDHEERICVTSLPAGLYFIRISGGPETYIQKFIR